MIVNSMCEPKPHHEHSCYVRHVFCGSFYVIVIF